MKDTTILPEGYKQTKVGVIPEEWHPIKLKDCLREIKDKSYPPHSKVPYLGLEHLDSGAMNINGYGDSSVVQSNCSEFNAGNILYGKLRPYLDKAIISPFGGICSTEIVVMDAKENSMNQFLIYHIHSDNFVDYNISHAFGTKMPRTSFNIIGEYLLPLPPLPEQHRIATILSTVDAAITATDEVIAKTEDLKRGLMQDLLTKGIDEEGRVRSEETHEFCEKQGMRVPVEWHPTKMKDCLREIKDKSYPPHSEVPYLGLEHFDSGAMKVNGSGDSSLVQSNCSVFKEGNILYGKLRPYLDKAIISPFEGICSTEIVVMDAKENSMNQFLIYHIHSDDFVGYNVSHAFGTKMPRTSFNIIEEYLLPLPPLPEQHRIAAVLSTVDRDLAAERNHRTRLQTLKKGLMQDLLTGRTRVPLNGGEVHGT